MRPFVSSWQHNNTLDAAHKLTGLELTPSCVKPRITMTEGTRRPSMAVDGRQYPVVFSKMYSVIPIYCEIINGKPDIKDWNLLRLSWIEDTIDV